MSFIGKNHFEKNNGNMARIIVNRAAKKAARAVSMIAGTKAVRATSKAASALIHFNIHRSCNNSSYKKSIQRSLDIHCGISHYINDC